MKKHRLFQPPQIPTEPLGQRYLRVGKGPREAHPALEVGVYEATSHPLPCSST